jgi:hypothetical protein
MLGLTGHYDQLILSPGLLPDNINYTTLYGVDRNYHDTYWKDHGTDMIKIAQDLAKNDPRGITSELNRFIWTPTLPRTNWMGAAPRTW